MIRLLQKLSVMWDKRRFLTLLQMERSFLSEEHRDILKRDVEHLREKLANLRSLPKPTVEEKTKMEDLEKDINETVKYRQIISTAVEKAADLEKQLRFYRETLWK